jgi:threonine dehydrogenase-like Zn-dependent dehydrogenase
MTATSTMRALVWTAPDEAVLRAEPVPEPAEGMTVLDVLAVGICGSDLHGYRGHSPVRTPPLILGHEVVGADSRGERFIVNPLIGCGRCRACRSGQPNLCPERGLLGLDRPGAFAQMVAAPSSNLIPLPDGMDPLVGTLVEPLATPMQALRLAGDVDGAVVAVAGCGTIGLLAAWAARQRGAQLVAAYDVDPARVDNARAIAHVAEVGAGALADVIREATDGVGADIVIDAVGIEATWTAAFDMVRRGGDIFEIGLGQSIGPAPIGTLVRDGIGMRGIYAYTPEDFRAALALLEASPPPLGWVDSASLDDGVAVLARQARGAGWVKVVFLP